MEFIFLGRLNMKNKTLRNLVDDLAVLLQKHVRLKSAVNGYCTCCTCGEINHWKHMQGGHFISRTHQGTKVMEENIHPQCKGCNLRSGKGDTLVTLRYREFMIDTYGAVFVDLLEMAANRPAEHFRPDIEIEILKIRRLNRELENRGD